MSSERWNAGRLCRAGVVFAAVAGGCSSSQNAPGLVEDEAEMSAVQVSLLREEALRMLGEYTSSDRAELRANAVEALGGIPGRVEAPAGAGLKDPNEAVRFAAAMVIGYDRIDSLSGSVRPLLRDPSASVRAAAVFAMTRCGHEVDRATLARTLLEDESEGNRANAAFVLGELGDPSALPLLREAVRDPMRMFLEARERLLRLQISEAMIKLGDESQLETVRAALYPSRPEELEAVALAVQIIGEVRDRFAMDQLIYLAAYRERGQMMPAEIRLAAAASIAKLGDPGGYPIAMEYAKDERPVLRAQSAYVLGQTGQMQNLDELEVLLHDENDQVRLTAASAIVDITGGRSVADGTP